MKSTPSFTWSQDIRTRRFLHRFGGVWVQAIVVTAPWLTVILIVGALFIVHGRIAITPGVLFDLPPTPLTEGAQWGGAPVLMFSVSRETLDGEETLVFFDDERYLLHNDEQFTRLADRIGDSTAREMLLLADKNVPHGDVMKFVNMARSAGVKHISVAQKPE